MYNFRATEWTFDFYLGCCQKTHRLPRAGRLSMSWELCLAKWVSSKRPAPYRMRCQSSCCVCWSLTYTLAPWAPSKAQSRVGALTFFSAGLPLSPGASLHYKTSDTKASGRYWRWANHFPGIPIPPEVLLQIRGEAEESGETDMAEWHWDLSWQYAGTRSSPVIPLETQGARQMIKQLHICFADSSVSENALWLGCRPESVLQICEQHKPLHSNNLVILAIGEQKMAGCLGHCSGAIVFLKNMYSFWRINSTSYLPCIYSLWHTGTA